MRIRLLDIVIATVCVACVGAPFIAYGAAASKNSRPSLAETSGSVDQRVLQTGMISHPLNGTFEKGTSGQVEGSIQWDVYTTAGTGVKLLVAADRSPAMREPKSGTDIPDYGSTVTPWSVGKGERRFGFSIIGALGMSKYADGKKWRGFDGLKPVEVGRRRASVPVTRSTIRLRADLGSGLPSDATPTATIQAIAVTNL